MTRKGAETLTYDKTIISSANISIDTPNDAKVKSTHVAITLYIYHSLVEPLLRGIKFTRITDDLERAQSISMDFYGKEERAELLEEPISFETPFVFDEETGYWQPADDAFGEKLAKAASW